MYTHLRIHMQFHCIWSQSTLDSHDCTDIARPLLESLTMRHSSMWSVILMSGFGETQSLVGMRAGQ